MTAEDIKAMPVAEKIQIMEALWVDMRDRFEHLELSPQLKELLDKRRTRVREGAAQILDGDSVKGTIGRP
ncbi:MAG: addiction module protein [Verrucomicrobiota bacterium]